jgi:mannosyltransferase OCH1-like enzyme
MIPKIIHQIWIGDFEVPDFCLEYQKQIKELYSDYEYKFWNLEDLQRFRTNKFVEHSIKNNYWGYVADWYRALILYEQGGIYLDIDIQAKDKISDGLLKKHIILPKESDYVTSNYIIGINKKHRMTKNMISLYDSYNDTDLVKNIWGAPEIVRESLLKTVGQYTILNSNDGTFQDSKTVHFIDINNNNYFNHKVGTIGTFQYGYTE